MNKVFIPVSIIVAGLIIAGAVVLTNNADNANPDVVQNEREKLELAPITNEDHIKGDPNAKVLLVEFSDFQCPYCAMFQGTLNRIAEEYVESGEVAIVYRHFPIPSHQTARPLAEASECVADLGGEDKFWNFTDEVYARVVTNIEAGEQDYSVSVDEMRDWVLGLGIDAGEYDKCLAEGWFKDRVEKDYQDGLNIARVDTNFGTPYNIIMTGDIQIPVIGNQPFAAVKNVIDAALTGNVN